MGKEWIRARSDEQREERRRSILNRAEILFREKGYEGVSLKGIAAGLKMERTNIYRYFKTREEIFLTLFSRDLKNWVTVLENSSPKPNPSPDDFAHWLTDSLLDQTELLGLIPQLALSLESNSSYEVLLRFKQDLVRITEGVGAVIQGIFPWMKRHQIDLFLKILLGLLSGLYPMSQPCELQKKVLTEPGLESLALDFQSALISAVSWMIGGMSIENR